VKLTGTVKSGLVAVQIGIALLVMFSFYRYLVQVACSFKFFTAEL
jgi:hypothetical protein